MQNRQFADMEEDGRLKEYLDRCTFINKDGEACEFTSLQKHDLNLVLQKRYRARARPPPSITGRNTCSNSARQGTPSFWHRPSPST